MLVPKQPAIANLICELRQELGLSQEQLASTFPTLRQLHNPDNCFNMNLDEFFQQLEELRSRFAAMQHRSSLEPLQKELLPLVLSELQTALEELAGAAEELRQQNEELCQQNEELVNARRLAEVERQIAATERQRYLELFEFAPDGYLVTDTEGTIQEANCAAAVLLNVSQQLLIGKSLFTFVAEPEGLAFQSQLRSLPVGDWVRSFELRLQPRHQRLVDVALTVAAGRNQQGKLVALRWLLRELTERKQAEAELLHNAFHDALTGLPNRALLLNLLEQAIEYGKLHENYLFAVLFLDLDSFKTINDSLGHVRGDQLLSAFAGRIITALRPTDTAARLGGDEFTILLTGIKDVSDALRVADRIQKELTLPFYLGEQEVFTTSSIGIALSTKGYDRPEDLLRDADTAMYRAKRLGAGHYEIFKPDMHVEAVARLQLETELRQAVERQEFRIHYQPIVSLATGFITGFEALVRWQHPCRGLILPAEFIPVATETGLSIPIDRWVLAQACRQIQQWQEQYPVVPPLTISVNLCRLRLAQPDLISHLDQVLRSTNLDAHRLKLEITERVMMEDASKATQRLKQLSELGVQLDIDDFGTGYSSLSRLHQFPINVLKIDRSFVSGSGQDSGNLNIIETIVTLAHRLGVEVTAEGVETRLQLQQLRELKCEYGQGYFFSRPLSSEAAEALLAANPQW